MYQQVVWSETTKNDDRRKASSKSMDEDINNPTVMTRGKNNSVFTYQMISESLNTRLKLPFKNNRYNKEKFIPDKNMNIVTTYSI
jgi:hypothetical protein